MSRQTAGLMAIVAGVFLVLGAIVTYSVVSSTLAEQNITVADDASCLAGDDVNGPFSAYCEAQIIDKHALDATGGLTYAELGREDPLRGVAQSASFLRASLFTSVVAFGVAAMAALCGVMFMMLGMGIREVAAIKE
jgi:hypothetical protein